MGDQRFELVVYGRRHVVDARDVGLQRELVWTVDDAEVAWRRTMDDRVELRWTDRGARLEVRAGMLGVRRATVHVDGEQVDLRPSAGSAAARREERIRRHPRRHAVVETVVAGFKVVAPLLLVGLGIRLLPDWDLPSIPWPDWDLPSIPWPDVELPSLPAIPWPDWNLPAWVDEVRAVLKYVGPVLLALALAVGEVRRRRDQDARRDAVAGPRGGPADRLPGMDHDWSTPEGLAAIKDALASTIEGWQAPVAYGVGISPASSSPELEFPHVNSPGGTHGLPAVVLAKIVGHAHGTATYPLSRSQLEAAVETLRPAEACTSMDHPNLAAFRTVLAELDSNPAREAHVVFIGDLDDPVSSEADATLRTLVQT